MNVSENGILRSSYHAQCCNDVVCMKHIFLNVLGKNIFSEILNLKLENYARKQEELVTGLEGDGDM